MRFIILLFIAHHVLSSGDLNWAFIAGYETPLQIKAKLTAVLQNSDLSSVTEKKVLYKRVLEVCAYFGSTNVCWRCVLTSELVLAYR